MFVLALSVIGFVYRTVRIVCVPFSRMMLNKKYHGEDLNHVYLSSSDCFVLELIIQNLNSNPIQVKQFIKELSIMMKENEKRQTNKNENMENGFKKEYVSKTIELASYKELNDA